MFTNILLATDGSYCALKAASAAAEIARRFDARVTIVAVYQPGSVIASTETPFALITEPETKKHDQSGILAATSRLLDDSKACTNAAWSTDIRRSGSPRSLSKTTAI